MHIVVKMGSSVGSGIRGLFMAGKDSDCGNLFVFISTAGYFECGFKCHHNADDVDGTVKSTTTVQADTTYDVKCMYDGTTATISVNSNQESSQAKSWKHLETIEKITIGRGASTEAFQFGDIQHSMLTSLPLMEPLPTTTTLDGPPSMMISSDTACRDVSGAWSPESMTAAYR